MRDKVLKYFNKKIILMSITISIGTAGNLIGASFPTVNDGSFSGQEFANGWVSEMDPVNDGGMEISLSGGRAKIYNSKDDGIGKMQLYYNFSTVSSATEAWKISAKLLWHPSVVTDFGAKKTFEVSTIKNNVRTNLFSLTLMGTNDVGPYSTTLLWSTPTGSGKYIDQEKDYGNWGDLNDGKDIPYIGLSIEYDPTSGYVDMKIDNASIYKGITNEKIQINSIRILNDLDGTSSRGALYIDDVKAEYVAKTPLILHGIPNGTFDNAKTAEMVPGGRWSKHVNWNPSAKVYCDAASDDKTNGVVKLENNWYPHWAKVRYTDNDATPTNIPWRISVDLKGTYTRHYRNDIFALQDVSGATVFALNVKGSTESSYSGNHSYVQWKAGSKTGTVTDGAEIRTDFFQTLSLEYNPISGHASGKIGDKTIFIAVTDPGMRIKSVTVTNGTDGSTWDPGILLVDNFRTEIIPDISEISVLHNIPHGSCSGLPDGGTMNVSGGVWWQAQSTNSGNQSWDALASTKVMDGAENNRHIELWQGWKSHYACISFNDYKLTPNKQAWILYADLKRTFEVSSATPRSDEMLFQDNDGHNVFALEFDRNTVMWKYFDETQHYLVQDEVISQDMLSNNKYEQFALEYNPNNGKLTVYRNDNEIYTTIVNMNIRISKIMFKNSADANTWDPGTLYVDNIGSLAVQNREITFRGMSTPTLDFDKLSTIKSWGANQVRYIISPTFDCQAMYNSSTSEPEYVNTYPFWDMHMSELSNGLENARKLGLAVVINIHHVPTSNWSTQPDIWATQEEMETFKLCWREITDVTQHANQVLWLELSNEPNTNKNDPCLEQTAWNSLAQSTIDEIRGKYNLYNNQFIDTLHPIVFASGPGALDWGLRHWPQMEDAYFPVIYTVHQWQNEEYTEKAKVSRPDKHSIRSYIKESRNFQKFFGVRMWVGEFGSDMQASERDIWLKEHIDIFEEYNWDWSIWADGSKFFPEINGVGSPDVVKAVKGAFKLNE